MFITLQEIDGAYEATMHDVLPAEMFDFLAPRGTEWDAPLVGSAFVMPRVPGPEIYDLRSRRSGKPTVPLPDRDEQVNLDAAALEAGAIGSNNWAVSGRLTPDGQAILANDMHLSIRVPNTWYRAALEWTGADGGTRRLVGVTLPGVPALVVGSNTQVAGVSRTPMRTGATSWTRRRRDHAHAHGTGRAPAFTVLWKLARRVGRRNTDAADARTHGAHAETDAVKAVGLRGARRPSRPPLH
jgi:penicillin amidase